MELTPERKEMLDAMTYREMLRDWRQCSTRLGIFEGELGDYFTKTMFEKKRKLSEGEKVKASKSVEWITTDRVPRWAK